MAAEASTGWGDYGAGGGLGQVCAALANDFNNVLTVITGNLALAERHAAGNPRLLHLLQSIREASDRGALLTQQLLALAPEAAREAALRVSGMAEESGWGGGGKARILVVEDDPHVAELAVVVLEEMGLEVTLCVDAASALAELRERGQPADRPAFDLVFSDIVMPGGMSGIELAETIAMNFPAMPVLLATGYSLAALTPGALRFPVLAKPYTVQELTRRITQLVQMRL